MPTLVVSQQYVMLQCVLINYMLCIETISGICHAGVEMHGAGENCIRNARDFPGTVAYYSKINAQIAASTPGWAWNSSVFFWTRIEAAGLVLGRREAITFDRYTSCGVRSRTSCLSHQMFFRCGAGLGVGIWDFCTSLLQNHLPFPLKPDFGEHRTAFWQAMWPYQTGIKYHWHI